MPKRQPREHLDFARSQRAMLTRAEKTLWQALRGSRLGGLKFRRQVPVGIYTADFPCVSARLIVELDGEPHGKDDQRRRDKQRDDWLASQGYSVLRISNDLVIGGQEIAVQWIRAAAKNI